MEGFPNQREEYGICGGINSASPGINGIDLPFWKQKVAWPLQRKVNSVKGIPNSLKKLCEFVNLRVEISKNK